MLSAELILQLLLNDDPCVLRFCTPLLGLRLEILYLFLFAGDLVFKRLVLQKVLARHVSLLLELCRDPSQMFALEFQIVV